MDLKRISEKQFAPQGRGHPALGAAEWNFSTPHRLFTIDK
jgi:hypothetical protein